MEGDNPGSWVQRFQDQFEQHPEAIESVQSSPDADSKTNSFGYFLRSVLFSSVPSKSRVFIKNQLLANQRGIRVKFTGMRLSQADLAVWDALLYLVQKQSLKDTCLFTRDSILTLMKLPTNADYKKALESSIDRLTLAMFILENDKCTHGSSLVHFVKIDNKTGKFAVSLDSDLIPILRKDS